MLTRDDSPRPGMRRVAAAAGTAALTAGLLAVGAAPAHAADEVTVTAFASQEECGVVTLQVDSADGVGPTWYFGIRAWFELPDSDSGPMPADPDGNFIGSALLQGVGSESKHYTLPEDYNGGTATVYYYIHAATEWTAVADDHLNRQSGHPAIDEHFYSFEVDTDCEAPAPEPGLPDTGVDSTALMVAGGGAALLLGAGLAFAGLARARRARSAE